MKMNWIGRLKTLINFTYRVLTTPYPLLLPSAKGHAEEGSELCELAILKSKGSFADKSAAIKQNQKTAIYKIPSDSRQRKL